MKVPHSVVPRTRPSAQGMDYLRPADTSGLMAAIRSGAASLEAIGETLTKRQNEMNRYEALNKFNDFEMRAAEKTLMLQRDSAPNDANYNDRVGAELKNLQTEFLSGLPPDLREEFNYRSGVVVKNGQVNALEFQLKKQDAYVGTTLEQALNQGKAGVNADPTTLETYRGRLYEQIDKAPISETQKFTEKLKVDSELEKLGFKAAVKNQGYLGQDPEFYLNRFNGVKYPQIAFAQSHPVFRGRLQAAIQEAEAATGAKAEIRSMFRTQEQQTEAYERYKTGKGGIAAPPAGTVLPNGKVAAGSRHQFGFAADLNDGPVLQWLRANAAKVKEKYGLEFLPDKLNDFGHIQLSKKVDVSNFEAPQTASAFESLWRGVYANETSSGANVQVSSAGAAGPAQMKPIAFREMAKDDPTIDPNMSDKQIQDFLQDPKNRDKAIELGKGYLRKQLVAFDGDWEVALIAYFKGPGFAKDWVDNGRDYAALPKDAIKYVNDAISNMGTPDNLDFDTRFKNVPFEDKQAIRDDVTREINGEIEAVNKQAAAVREAAMNEVLIGIHDGTKGQQDIDNLRTSGIVTDYSDIAKLDEALKKSQGDKASAVRGFEKLSRGELFSPTDQDDMKSLNAMVGRDGITALSSMDKGYVESTLLPLVKATHDIPTDIIGALMSLSRSGDVARSTFALDTLSNLQTLDGSAFAQRTTAAVASDVAYWDATKNLLPHEQIVRELNGVQTPQERQTKDYLRKEAAKILTDRNHPDYVTADWALNQFNGTFSSAELSTYEPAAQLFKQEFNTRFIENYARDGNATRAKDATIAAMKVEWGWTGVGKSMLMKYPPELMGLFPNSPYKNVNGEIDWMNEAFAKEAGLKEGAAFQLIGDEQTGREFNAWRADPSKNRPPSYGLVYENEQGVLELYEKRIWLEPPQEEIINREQEILHKQKVYEFNDFYRRIYQPAYEKSFFNNVPFPPELEEQKKEFLDEIDLLKPAEKPSLNKSRKDFGLGAIRPGEK